MKKKIAMIVSLTLVLAVGIGATIAWLTDSEGPIVNTFKTSKLGITLSETPNTLDGDNDSNTNSYKMIPGHKIAKDPKVTVDALSETCYLFVKITESGNYDTYFEEYDVREPWQQLVDDENNAVDGVYYCTVDAETAKAGTSYYVLEAGETGSEFENGYVVVNDEVTKEQMDELTTGFPTLTFSAYAIQQYKTNNTAFEPYEAWQNIAK